MSQKCLHQRMLNTTIVKNFTIVLQYNSNFRIVLQHNSKKKKYILFHLCLLRKFLLALSGTSFPFSLFVLRISICSILSSDPNSSQHQHQHHTPSSIAEAQPIHHQHQQSDTSFLFLLFLLFGQLQECLQNISSKMHDSVFNFYSRKSNASI